MTQQPHSNAPATLALLLVTRSPPASGGHDTLAPALDTAASFQSFFTHALHAGLGVVRCYDASALLEYAEQTLVLEQKLATGCFLLQAVLLVEYFVRTTPCLAWNREHLAQDFGS